MLDWSRGQDLLEQKRVLETALNGLDEQRVGRPGVRETGADRLALFEVDVEARRQLLESL